MHDHHDPIPERLNIADWFLGERLREGRGDRVALRTDGGDLTYADVAARAARYAHVLQQAGVQPEQRVILALDDGLDWVAAFFGTLQLGAVVVMVNPSLKAESFDYFLGYTRASAAVVDAGSRVEFEAAAKRAPMLRTTSQASPSSKNVSNRRRPTSTPSPAIATTRPSGSSRAAPRASPRRSYRATTRS